MNYFEDEDIAIIDNKIEVHKDSNNYKYENDSYQRLRYEYSELLQDDTFVIFIFLLLNFVICFTRPS